MLIFQERLKEQREQIQENTVQNIETESVEEIEYGDMSMQQQM